MKTDHLDPGEYIDLASSDAETPVSKKRPLDDSEEPASRVDETSSLREVKRLKKSASIDVNPEANPDSPSSEEGEIDENESPNQAQGEGTSTESQDNSTGQSGTTGVFLAADPPVFSKDGLLFKLPSLSEKKEGSWFTRFKDWVRSFQFHNSEHTEVITPNLARAAYAHYIEHNSGLKPKKRRSAKQAAKELETTGDLQALLHSIQPESASRQPENSTSETKGHDKSSRRSSAADAEHSGREDNQESDSEVEYEPTLTRSEQDRETIPSASEWASLLGDSSGVNGHSNGQSKDLQGQRLGQNGTTMVRKGVPTGSEALVQQRRYFPSASDPSNMCLLCGRVGHTATSCSTLSCKFCGDHEHSDLSCPTRVRCDKCRQLGHQKAKCPEKLALTKDEGLACVICNSPSHLEKDCTELWRSFHPDAGTISRVRFIAASCSLCGSNKHFSTDCSSCRDGYANPTWSIENRDQYVDPECGSRAIEEDMKAPENIQPMRGEIKIRGHAARTNNVHYSESEDSEVEFLGRKPLKQRAPVGQIRMASNIQMPQQNTSRGGYSTRKHSQTQALPPLPPGPPPPGLPPGPPPGSTLSRYPPPPGLPSIPPSSLPAKPPTKDSRETAGKGGQNRQQGQRGGRGGGRGGGGGINRGGGRGRGRGGRGRGRGKQ